MTKQADVCIIGGGVMGLSAAHYLAKRHKRVIIVERKDIGSGASGACDDMILTQSKKPGVALTMALESLELYKSLSAELDEFGFENRGGAVLIETREQMKTMEALVKRQATYGLQIEMLGKKELAAKQPHCSERFIGSTYCSLDSQVDPFLFLRALLKSASANGLRILRLQSPCAIYAKGDHWKVDLNDTSIECDQVLLAAGAWTAQLAALCDVAVPITPKRGQLAITEVIPEIGETNCWSANYIASKLDTSGMSGVDAYAKQIGLGFSFGRTLHGNYVIGSTREYIGFDVGTYEKAIARVVGQALNYFPVLRTVKIIRTIAGLRPATPDSNPIIGAIDGREGLYIVSGHEGDGIALAPISGKLVADIMCGRQYNKAFDAVNLRRFTEHKGSGEGEKLNVR